MEALAKENQVVGFAVWASRLCLQPLDLYIVYNAVYIRATCTPLPAPYTETAHTGGSRLLQGMAGWCQLLMHAQP